jgi:hypothetical protein
VTFPPKKMTTTIKKKKTKMLSRQQSSKGPGSGANLILLDPSHHGHLGGRRESERKTVDGKDCGKTHSAG